MFSTLRIKINTMVVLPMGVIFMLSFLHQPALGQEPPPKPISPLHPEYEARKGSLVQYRAGDIMIGVLAQIHSRDTGDKCGVIVEDGLQAIETINMVVDQVNANSSILPGLRLGTVMVDTCDIDTHALQMAVRTLLPYFWNQQANASASNPVFAGVIGAFSSAVSIQTASLLQIFKIPQISPFSTNPSLSNKNRFPYFFRVVPSDTFQARAMITLVKQRKWNYISIVYEGDTYGLDGFREISYEAQKRGICVALSHAIPRTPTTLDFKNIIDKLLTVKEARAVIVFTKRHDAERLIEAAQANPKSRGYFMWIGSDGWSGSIPTKEAALQYAETLDGALTFNPRANAVGPLAAYMSNLTLGQHLHGNYSDRRNPWFPEYIARRTGCSLGNYGIGDAGGCEPGTRLDISTFTTFNHNQNPADATLAFVAALQKYHQLYCAGEIGCRRIKGMVGTNKLAEQIYSILKNITFTGINGDEINFDSNQDGVAAYDLELFEKNLLDANATGTWSNAADYRNGEITFSMTVRINDTQSVCSQPCEWNQATVNDTLCCWHCVNCSGNTYVENNGNQCVECPTGFKPNPIKRGCVRLEIKSTRYGSSFSISSMTLSAVGIILTLAFGGVFFKHRDTAVVKASGKELCVLVLGGAILCFLDSFVLSAPASVATCAISRVFLAFGPTLMYSGLLAKTIRVVIIFRSKSFLSPQVKSFLRPTFQILTTFGFVFIQVLVIAVWFVVMPPSVSITYPNNDVAFHSCNDVNHLLVMVCLAYPFILIAACTILASVNRNVPTGFKETQYIGFTMYATCVTWLAFLPIFITNSSNVPLKVATLAICLNLSAIVVLICLFGFRCYVIIFHPERNTSKSVMSIAMNGATGSDAPKKETENRVIEVRN